MRLSTLAAMAVSTAAFGLGSAPAARADAAPRLSGPYVHENLSVYFLHAPSADGPVPLTLAEALVKGGVEVHETGSVNTLEIENSGDADVFIQAGDIVKGGQQDRVLMMSMILPAKSGKVPIGSFCVEQGRWSRRGAEDVKRFASSAESMPSRTAKLAMRAPAAAPNATAGAQAGAQAAGGVLFARRNSGSGDDTGSRQHEVWAAVAGVQNKLRDNLGGAVAAPQSATSLQLSLENQQLQKSRQAYISGLQDKAAEADIVGYVFAVNGKINSADQYPSNGLFKKMWPKLLAASATEAIGEGAQAAGGAAPTAADVAAFLVRAETSPAEDKPLGTLASQRLRNSETVLFVEARRPDGAWVHRNYLAK